MNIVSKGMKSKTLKAISCFSIMFLLSACGNTAKQSETVTTTKSSFIVTSDMVSFDKEDEYSDWENESTKYIKLDGKTTSNLEEGISAEEGKITISNAGTYAISGTLDDGQIIVDTKDEGVVRLVLCGATINSSDSAPIYVKNSEKTIISLENGKENIISDGSSYKLDDEEEPSGAIFSKDTLVINGDGKLTVKANYKDGIVSKDTLKILEGTFNINSKDDALVGRDMVLLKDGNYNIESGGDGIKSTNDKDENKGYIGVVGGNYNINASKDAVQAETSILISDGTFNITTAGGSESAPVKSDKMGMKPMRDMTHNFNEETEVPNPNHNEEVELNKKADVDKETNSNKETNLTKETNSNEEESETESKKGIKAKSDISIAGGNINIDSYDDGIHSNISVNISGGDLKVASGDDGVHSDSVVNIDGGKVNITKSYEGIEGMNVNITNGDIYVTASDDGINVNGGNDSSNSRDSKENPFAVSENSKLTISGGYLLVDSSGDGLDSNGSIVMTGGSAFVSGPTDNSNGALDYNGEFTISGGILVAAGSDGMAQAPSENSTQGSVLMYYSDVQKENTNLYLTDKDGKEIVSFAPKKQYSSVVISTPEVKKGESYTLYSGGNEVDGNYKDGTEVINATFEDIVTYLSESGITTKKGQGAGGMRGEKGDRPAKMDGFKGEKEN